MIDWDCWQKKVICFVNSCIQTRREKILEAKNKEMRLKEKTKVIICNYHDIMHPVMRVITISWKNHIFLSPGHPWCWRDGGSWKKARRFRLSPKFFISTILKSQSDWMNFLQEELMVERRKRVKMVKMRSGKYNNVYTLNTNALYLQRC